MAYVDGFLLTVPKKNLAAYKKVAGKAGKVWRDHGALQYIEAVGDDLNVKMGMPFPKLTNSKANEVTIFAFIVYKSRKHRDTINKKVMKDARMAHMDCAHIFDMNKMSWGGFTTIVDAK